MSEISRPPYEHESEHDHHSDFGRRLVNWYRQNKRSMPWRDCGNPYFIWISEIMLQQTRVDQATPYFLRFTEQFPDVKTLAEAGRQDVLKAWEGLGYYSRARNLHDAAGQIMQRHEGVFPQQYDDIRALKGIGPYTAAAVSSIAFDLPHAVMDGNVIRVISRYFGIEEDVSRPGTQKQIQELVDELLGDHPPSDFNQGMMELGATICTPKKPACLQCPLQDDCVAAATAKTEQLPYKTPKKKVPHHQIVVGICRGEDDKLLIALRPDEKMLGGLWEFPGGKVEEGESRKEALIRELREELGVEVEVNSRLTELKHAYSHFRITMNAYLCRITNGEPRPKESKELRWISADELDDYPFPKANRKLTVALRQYLDMQS